MDDEIIDTLKEASTALLFPSESEYPFEVLRWEDAPKEINKDDLIRFAQRPADTTVETIELDAFFRNVTTEQDWHEEPEKKDVQRFRQLLKLLKTRLSEVNVYRLGEVEID